MEDVIIGAVVDTLLELSQRDGVKSQLDRRIYRGPADSDIYDLFVAYSL